MVIDGRAIAEKILINLRDRTNTLKANGITPHLYIILLTDNTETLSYIKQKILFADKVGIKITIDRDNPKISTEEIITKIDSLNNNRGVHGIILQRPAPKEIDVNKVENIIAKEKEVDGFGPNSKFDVPVALAVYRILLNIHTRRNESLPIKDWLNTKNIVIIGKGETAGNPISEHLKKLSIIHQIVDSKTTNKADIIKNSDIVISAVGKPNIINSSDIKSTAIVIGVGIHIGDDGKIHGDYSEDDIMTEASYYTPTPGGVGPINVACLMENLIIAAERELS